MTEELLKQGEKLNARIRKMSNLINALKNTKTFDFKFNYDEYDENDSVKNTLLYEGAYINTEDKEAIRLLVLAYAESRLTALEKEFEEL